jgi:hypothetical protein
MFAHELLYRFFTFETLWANVFLVLAFVLYAALLRLRRGTLGSEAPSRQRLSRVLR